MASVLEQYKAKKAAEAAKGAAAPATNPPEAEKILAGPTQAEVNGARQQGDPLKDAPSSGSSGFIAALGASAPSEPSSAAAAPASELTRGQKAAATRAAKKAAGGSADPSAPDQQVLAILPTEDLRDELVRRGWTVALT